MKAWQRSLSGLLLAIVLVPILAGLLACLPVPVGDPERSRIDPELTGVWFGFEGSVTYFEPWDKQTWLVTTVGIKSPPGCRPADTKDNYAKLVAWLEAEQCARAEEAEIFKAWRSKQGGHWFLTLQPMAMVDADKEDPFAHESWFVYRIDKASADSFKLLMVDPEFRGFEGLPETRRAYEKIIRRHADDDEMFLMDTDPLVRIKGEHIELFAMFVEEHIDID